MRKAIAIVLALAVNSMGVNAAHAFGHMFAAELPECPLWPCDVYDAASRALM